MALSAKLTDGGMTALPSATADSPPLPRLFESISEKLILLSASLWMVQSKRVLSPSFRLASRLCSSAAILIGAITLIEYVTGWNTGFDQLLIKENPGALYTFHLGQPSPLAALNLVLAGVAIIMIDTRAAGEG